MAETPSTWKVPSMVVNIAFLVVIAVVGWLLRMIIWNNVELRKGDRYTLERGVLMETHNAVQDAGLKTMNRDLTSLLGEVKALDKRLVAREMKKIPPPDFEQRVSKNEQEIRILHKDLDRLNRTKAKN